MSIFSLLLIFAKKLQWVILEDRKTEENWAQPRHQELTLQWTGQLGCTQKSRAGTCGLNTYATSSWRGSHGNLCGSQDCNKRSWKTDQLQNQNVVLWLHKPGSISPSFACFVSLHKPNNYAGRVKKKPCSQGRASGQSVSPTPENRSWFPFPSIQVCQTFLSPIS